MDWRKECAAIIPCLNEADTIQTVVRGVSSHLPAVFVVDDGSADATAAEAQNAGATVLRHQATRGKGAALNTGWAHALKAGFAWALCLDGDGQHAADDIPGFFRCAEATSADLVVGNRMQQPDAMPWVRRAVNRWMSRRLGRAAGLVLPDSQCGFRLLRLKAWAELQFTTTHFEVESELLLAFIRARYRVEFFPVRTIYTREQSKIHPVRDAVRWMKWWRRARRPQPSRRAATQEVS